MNIQLEENNDIDTHPNNTDEQNNGDNNKIPSHNNKAKNDYPSYFAIRVPAKVTNIQKAIELLGGKREIMNKNAKNENIELNLFTKKIPLEKCISNDLLLKKKTKRNKKKYYFPLLL